jgi:hypothetical protein
VEHNDGIDAIESVQFHADPQLRELSSHLVDRYYGEDYGLQHEDEAVQAVDPTELPAWRRA